MSGDLIAFLKARLDEDEQAADIGAQLHEDEPADPSYAGGIVNLEDAGWEPGAARRFNDYVTRFDPARVLHEVEAKRSIIAELWDEKDDFPTTWTASGTASAVLRRLALPYADHPDYRQEWQP
ncbi:DUF6221 family protein [Streptosporangium sp. NPDC001559]|uniref:DUF6221 family protein n=1 Tax=Streptosporangium sp. NPDC001559 TaxID=3366187 RepID=UPI0036F169E3